MTEPNTLEQFENLGDNCKFGFVQRSAGIDPGSLLKWAVSRIDPLINALNSRFSEIYKFENLTPSWDDMVLDTASGLCFDRKMFPHVVEEVRSFVLNRSERQAIYDEERQKIDYLIEKLIENLAIATKVFVYKCNYPIEISGKIRLHDALLDFNRSNALLVVETGEDVGRAVQIAERRLYVGTVDRLAPYEPMTYRSKHGRQFADRLCA